jgi:hypothetical protein
MNRIESECEKKHRRGRAVLVARAPGDANGHVRITFGDDLRVEGGDETVHAILQKRAVAIREELERRGLSMRDISKLDYEEIVRVVSDCTQV